MRSKGSRLLAADNIRLFCIFTLDYLLEESNEFQISLCLKIEKKGWKKDEIEIITGHVQNEIHMLEQKNLWP